MVGQLSPKSSKKITQNKCTTCFNTNTSNAHVLFAVWNVSGGISSWCRCLFLFFFLALVLLLTLVERGEKAYVSQCRSYPDCFQHRSTSVAPAAIHIGCHSLKVKKFCSFCELERGVTWQLSVPFMFLQPSLALELELFLLLCFQITVPMCHLLYNVFQTQYADAWLVDLSVHCRNGVEPDKTCPLPDRHSGIACMTTQDALWK